MAELERDQRHYFLVTAEGIGLGRERLACQPDHTRGRYHERVTADFIEEEASRHKLDLPALCLQCNKQVYPPLD